MKHRFDNDWGVVQELRVEADTFTALLAAVTIAMTQHKSVSHYEFTAGSLYLFWGADSGGGTSTKLPYELKTPEKVADFCRDWLEQAKYPEAVPDTDGSVDKGFQLDARVYGWAVFRLTPCYIVYGK